MDDSGSQEKKIRRGAVYIDGFNLYHPIKDTNQSHLKWSNLWEIGRRLCAAENLDLVKVVFCTAVPKHIPDSRDRHNKFNAAQIAHGVVVLKGHHVPDSETGKYSEKQSDINVALSVMLDGIDDVYDVAFLVSADSDQVATAKFFKERLEPLGKQLIAVIPLSKTYPPDYAGLGVVQRRITVEMIEESLMPSVVQGRTGPIFRPEQYDPPENWVAPKDRPIGKAPKPPKRGEWSKPFKSRG